MRNWKFNHIDFSTYPCYGENDLGVFWTPEKTLVKIWAPTARVVELRLYKEGKGGEAYFKTNLQSSVNGTWSAVLTGDYEGKFYSFKINDGEWLSEVPDIYTRCVGVNGNKESTGKTAKQWSQAHKLTAAINGGMFAKDYKTHVGYMRVRDRLYNSKVNKYRSVVAFDPRRKGAPRFRIFDLDGPGVTMKRIVRDYASAVQNLRLIKRPRRNRWPRQDKKWSEVALGEDKAGRILFIFCRSPMTMHDLNHELLRLRIGLVCAQHLEGGPPAQLYLKAGGVELDLCGSYETSIQEDDGNVTPWRIPHVLGVRPR